MLVAVNRILPLARIGLTYDRTVEASNFQEGIYRLGVSYINGENEDLSCTLLHKILGHFYNHCISDTIFRDGPRDTGGVSSSNLEQLFFSAVDRLVSFGLTISVNVSLDKYPFSVR